MSRYNSRKKAINKNEQWKKVLEDRGLKEVKQYTTPALKNPTEEQLARIQTKDYIWKNGDRLWRIAANEFGDGKLWWIIARLNNKPTESMFDPGDIVKIPLNIAVALEVLG
jgi:nucleoid-associated protein YgaU